MSDTPKYTNNFNVRDDLKGLSVDEIKATRESKDFAVATFNLKGDLNLGSIMRTAEITGAKDFFILGHRSWDRRSAVGVQNYLPVHKFERVENYRQVEVTVGTFGYVPIIVEHGGMNLDTWKRCWSDWNVSGSQKPCFIFGPEDTGFPEDFPAHLSLEQAGVSRSYNVSAAAAIILYDWSFS